MTRDNPSKKKSKSSKRALMLIGGSEAIGQAAGIIRRLIILRTIGLENYGIAIPMLLVLGLLNRLLEINPGTTLVQDRMGGGPASPVLAPNWLSPSSIAQGAAILVRWRSSIAHVGH